MSGRVALAGLLEAIFQDTLARLDPAARVSQALAELGWAGTAATADTAASAADTVDAAAAATTVDAAAAASGPTIIVAAGKAAAAMARGALVHAPDARGVVVVPAAHAAQTLGNLQVMAGSHPVPDARSVSAAAAVIAAVTDTAIPRNARVLALISGGASALMAMPAPGLRLEDKIATTSAIAASGADIHALNVVRKHLSSIKGGQLAAMCPVPVTTLIASDVVGDDPAAVGSGPTVADPSTFRQACDIVARAVGLAAVPRAVREHLERGARGEIADTPARPRPGDRVLVISGTEALVAAAQAAAAGAGAAARVFARGMVGDVADVARRVAAQVRRLEAARPPGRQCFVAGGEATLVVPRDHGVGGRAQQLALLVARDIAGVEGIAVLVAGSDGIDGNSPAAGAVIGGDTWEAIGRAGVDPERALARCDAYAALAAVGATLVTGPTGVNHADLIVIASGH